MSKKILCLLLAALFAMTAMVGCSDTSEKGELDPTKETDRYPVTLNMWVVCEEMPSPEVQDAVEAAFSSITEKTYTTRVNLIYSTEEEYKANLDAQFDLVDRRPAGTKFTQSTKIETEIVDGVKVLKYPTPNQYQTDIVLILGRDMFNEYVREGRLKSLNDNLANASKAINAYIYSDILAAAKVRNTWYAIPNNHIIGNYTYMMINKEMANKYYYHPEDFTEFGVGTAAAQLIDQIAQNEDLSKIAPMYGMADYPLAKYWTDNGDKSIISTTYPTTGTQIGVSVSAGNIFADPDYKAFMQQMFYCKENGYFLTDQEEFGIGIFEGDYEFGKTYSDDYYVVILDYPRLEEEAVFNSMFAVTQYTANQSRAMEIITALTCKSELRNLLQYGIEDEHYELDDDGAVVRLNDDYKMNVNYTGNVFLAYPEQGMDVDRWREFAIAQNVQSMLSVVCGSGTYLEYVDRQALAEMRAVSSYYFERLYACETYAEFEEYLKAASREIVNAPYYEKLTKLMNGDQYDLTSINGAITQWWYDTYSEK